MEPSKEVAVELVVESVRADANLHRRWSLHSWNVIVVLELEALVLEVVVAAVQEAYLCRQATKVSSSA